MPILTDLRLIDLNFDYDKAHIQDLMIKVKGKESLWLIRNGGGKSVMSQMIMQPYVFSHNRDYPKRNFRSYLQLHKPFYELHQYKLDDDAGFIVVCFMALRSTNEENGSEQVSISTVIGEFPVKVDVGSIPFFYKDASGRSRLKSFDEMVGYFNKTPKYEVFHLGRTKEETERYIKTLYKYKIDVNEWSEIIRVANLDESGLSKFFEGYYKASDIARRLFLPKVETKLATQGISLDKYTDSIYTHYKNIENNKENLKNEQLYRQFLSLSEVVEKDIISYIDNIEKRDKADSLLRQYHAYVKQCRQETNNKLQMLYNEIKEADDFIKELEYEKSSFEYHKALDKRSKLSENELQINQKIIAVENNSEKAKFEISCLECARLDAQLKKNEPKLENLKARREKIEQGEDVEKIKSYKYTLHYKYTEEIDKNKKLKEALEEKRAAEKSRLNILSSQKDRETKEQNDIKIKLNKIDMGITNIEEEIQSFSKFYEDFIPVKTFLGYDKNYFLDYIRTLDKEQKKTAVKLKEIIQDKSDLSSKITEGHTEINNITNQINGLHYKLEQLQKEVNNYIIAKNKLEDILNNYNIDISELFNKEFIISKLSHEELLLEKNNRALSEKSIDLHKEIEKLKNNEVFSVPNQFKNQLEIIGIEYQTGFEYLKNNPNISLEKKKQLLESNEFIPYSLLVEDDQSVQEILAVDENVPFPIPIMKKVDIFNSVNNDMAIKFYTGFNGELLDEERLQEKIISLEKERDRVEEEIAVIKNGIGNIREYKRIVVEFKYSNGFEEKIRGDISQAEEKVKSLENTKVTLTNSINEMNSLKGKLENEYTQVLSIQSNLESKARSFDKINSSLPTYYALLEQKPILENQVKEKDAIIETISYELSECNDAIGSLNEAIPRLESEISSIEEIAQDFNDAEETKLIDIEKDVASILKIYRALTKKYGDVLEDLNSEIGELQAAVGEDRKELNSIKTDEKIADSDYIFLKYSYDKKTQLDGLVKQNDSDIKELNKKLTNLGKEIGGVNNTINSIKKELFDLHGCEPKDRNSISVNKNYDKEISDYKSIKKNIGGEIEIENGKLKIIDTELGITRQYDLPFHSTYLSVINISVIDMEEYRTNLQNSYNNIVKQVEKNKEELYDLKFKEFISTFAGQSKVFEEALADFTNKNIDPSELLNKLLTVREVITQLLDRISLALTSLKEDENLIIEYLFEYIKRLYAELGEIDKGSTISTKDGARRKMLKVRLLYDSSYLTKDIVKMQVLDEIIRGAELQKEAQKDVLEYIKNFINAGNLFDRTFGMDSIDISLYKITERGISPQTFEEAKTNSGGEGSFTAFIILSCVMSYFRRNGINTDAGWKVMILDNPFAKMTSPHLLIPLFNLANKLQVQLICLSDIDTESVKDRFEDIHVFMHVPVKGIENETLLIEVGEEENKHISLSDNQFNFGYEEVAQTTLL